MSGAMMALLGSGGRAPTIESIVPSGTASAGIGYVESDRGSIAPPLSGIGGNRLSILYDVNSGSLFFRVALHGVLAQSFFTSLTINGVTFNTAGATSFFTSGGITYWDWTTPNVTLTAGVFYGITVT